MCTTNIMLHNLFDIYCVCLLWRQNVVNNSNSKHNLFSFLVLVTESYFALLLEMVFTKEERNLSFYGFLLFSYLFRNYGDYFENYLRNNFFFSLVFICICADNFFLCRLMMPEVKFLGVVISNKNIIYSQPRMSF